MYAILPRPPYAPYSLGLTTDPTLPSAPLSFLLPCISFSPCPRCVRSLKSGYDPNKSQVNEDRLAEFIRAPITGSIDEVPGIGDAAKKALASGEDDDKVRNVLKSYLNSWRWLDGSFHLIIFFRSVASLLPFKDHQHLPAHWQVSDAQGP